MTLLVKRPYAAASPKDPSAPSAAASVGVATPENIDPSTTR